MSRSAESATPIWLSWLSSLAPAAVGALELPDRAAAVDGLDGPLELAAQPNRGDRPEEQVVHEGEPAQHLVALGRVRHRHQHDLRRAAPAQPGLDLVALGLEAPRVGEHQRRPPPVERGLEGRERAHLLGRRAGGQVAGEDLARFTPDEKVGHGRSERRDGRSVAQGRGRRPSGGQEGGEVERPGDQAVRPGRPQRHGVEAPGDARDPHPGGPGARRRRSRSRRPSRSPPGPLRPRP